MKYLISRSAPRIPTLIEEEYPVEEIEDAAQVFKTQAEPPESWTLVEIVEQLATREEIRWERPDGKTVVARLVKAPVGA